MSELRPEDEARVLKLLGEGSRIHAIAELRRVTGYGLKEAVDALAGLESKIQSGAEDECLEWEIFAIGPFRRELRDCLDYPKGLYASTRTGATVITSVLMTNTRAAWELISATLGVVPDDLTTHVLDVDAVDLGLMAAVLDEREQSAFTRLRAAGFQFYFCPGFTREEA